MKRAKPGALVLVGLLIGCGAGMAVRSGATAQPSGVMDAPEETMPRTAVVDVQDAVRRTRQGRLAQAKLQVLYHERQEQLDAEQAKVRKEKADLDANGASLPPAVLERRQRELWQRLSQLQNEFTKYQQELEQAEAKYTLPIVANLRDLAAELSRGQGYELIVDTQAVLYAHPDLDLTEQLVERYDARHRGTLKSR